MVHSVYVRASSAEQCSPSQRALPGRLLSGGVAEQGTRVFTELNQTLVQTADFVSFAQKSLILETFHVLPRNVPDDYEGGTTHAAAVLRCYWHWCVCIRPLGHELQHHSMAQS